MFQGPFLEGDLLSLGLRFVLVFEFKKLSFSYLGVCVSEIESGRILPGLPPAQPCTAVLNGGSYVLSEM